MRCSQSFGHMTFNVFSLSHLKFLLQLFFLNLSLHPYTYTLLLSTIHSHKARNQHDVGYVDRSLTMFETQDQQRISSPSTYAFSKNITNNTSRHRSSHSPINTPLSLRLNVAILTTLLYCLCIDFKTFSSH